MDSEKPKKYATRLFILLLLMPVVATVFLLIRSNSEGQQFGVLQILLMGIYNIPFLVVAGIGLMNGARVRLLYIVSIVASITGTIVMAAWGLGLL